MAPGDFEHPFGAFFYLVPEKQEVFEFVKKFHKKKKGECP
jgi:hypothetical protein